MTAHEVSSLCRGETCRFDGCGAAATHKVREELPHDDPNPARHPLTAYVCCLHFRAIFSAAVGCPPPERTKEAMPETTRVQRRLSFAAEVCRERGWTLGALTPFQLKELQRLQDADPPSGAVQILRTPRRGDR